MKQARSCRLWAAVDSNLLGGVCGGVITARVAAACLAHCDRLVAALCSMPPGADDV